jgi:NADH:ubiquinone oxidoreductase subunit 2 (subunit N)
MGLLREGRVSVTLIALSFFNMAGLPPTVGFFVKIAILAPLIAVSGLGARGLLLAGSAVFVYLYLRFIINSTVWETHSPVWARRARARVVLLLLLGARGAALCLYI